MLIPIGNVNNMPITLLRVSEISPEVIDAKLTHFDGKKYQLLCSDTDFNKFFEGEQLLMDLGHGSQGRRRVRVVSLSSNYISVESVGRSRQERRIFPRIEGTISLSYRVVLDDEKLLLNSWLSTNDTNSVEALPNWIEPEDPFMDFSATGLRFCAVNPLDSGVVLLLKFKIPLVSDKIFFASAEVIRTISEDDGLNLVAIAFLDVSDEATDALMEYTRFCQDVALGLEDYKDIIEKNV